MSTRIEPSENPLALAGLVTNEAGRVFEPPCGLLEIPWLVKVAKEARHQARERFQGQSSLSDDERFTWFVVSTEPEFRALELLLKKDWRGALQAWSGEGHYQIHNRATLHRCLFLSRNTEKPEAHLRESLRLYRGLGELFPNRRCYRELISQLVPKLIDSIAVAYQRAETESTTRGLRVLEQVKGKGAVEQVQSQILAKDMEAFQLACARMIQELLPFQGQAHKPPENLIDNWVRKLRQDLIPVALRLKESTLEKTAIRSEIDGLMAECCGLSSQSSFKLGRGEEAKELLELAESWDSSTALRWTEESDDFTEEIPANVSFPERKTEEKSQPRDWGSSLFGVKTSLSQKLSGESREEWLESLTALFLPIFPLRRFAYHRELESGKVKFVRRIPLNTSDHLFQGLAVLLLSFGLTTLFFMGKRALGHSAPASRIADVEKAAEEIDELLAELKSLAKAESKLTSKNTLDGVEKQKLEQIRARRIEIITEMQELEARKRTGGD